MQRRITWAEMAIAYQAETGINLARHKCDLAMQEKVFRDAFKRVSRLSEIYLNGKVDNYVNLGPR